MASIQLYQVDVNISEGSAGNPVFIVGVLRSGTSLLHSLLNQHPRIALMYECDAWDFPPFLARQRFRGNWLERQEFYNRALSRHQLDWGGKLSGLGQIHAPDDLYRSVSELRGATFWGEKSPHYSARLAQLARRYPRASFILIWRDPLETYRSIRAAGRKTPYFRRPGMLHRLIYHQERMIRETGQIARAGARVHQVSYNDLVDRTGEVCRGICEFLGVPFHAAMTELKHADLSAVYDAPQHEFLRRRVIERQKFGGEDVVPPAVASKLVRFRNRWERLQGHGFGADGRATDGKEPGVLERRYHQAIGAALFAGKDAKRIAFEFLPLAWLRTYRLFKAWFRDGHRRQEPGIRSQFLENWPTITAGFALLAGVGMADYFTGPQVSMAAFYALPVMLLALIVDRRWGFLASVLAAGMWSLGQLDDKIMDWNALTVLSWNCLMRFAVLEILVLLLDRIRRELAFRANGTSREGPN
jgi:hypothetical protein